MRLLLRGRIICLICFFSFSMMSLRFCVHAYLTQDDQGGYPRRLPVQHFAIAIFSIFEIGSPTYTPPKIGFATKACSGSHAFLGFLNNIIFIVRDIGVNNMHSSRGFMPGKTPTQRKIHAFDAAVNCYCADDVTFSGIVKVSLLGKD